jgi:hypothetical protein
VQKNSTKSSKKNLVTDPKELDQLFSQKYKSSEILADFTPEVEREMIIMTKKRRGSIDPDNENLRFIIEI